MFKIGEFSKLSQVSVRMLRYYDQTGLLKPAQTDPWTGYRLYSAEQIPVLNKILYLRDSGFSVTEIAEALAEKDNRVIEKQLDGKYAEIEKTIRAEQEKLNKIKLAKREIMSGNSTMHYDITIKSIPTYQVLSLRRVIPDYYAEGQLWKELRTFAEEQKITFSGETFSLYHDEEYKEKIVDVELCAHVQTAGENAGDFRYRTTEAVPLMAGTMVYGDFSNIAGVYQAFAGWLQENSRFKMGTPSRQIVHRGTGNADKPEDYLVELQIPLTEKIPDLS